MRMFRLRESIRSSLWFIPTACVMASIAVAIGLGQLDERLNDAWIQRFTFRGDVETARTFLTTISTSMITFTGLVFTITIVVLQLASQQLSPRVLRTFLRDRLSQLSLGVFVATFTYSLVILRELGPGEKGDLVPDLSITFAFVLVLLSIGFFVAYINHISQAIRIGNLAEAIAEETDAAIRDIYDHEDVGPPKEEPTGDPVQMIISKKRGVLTAIDRDALVEDARRADSVAKVLPAVGDFIPSGAPVLAVYGDPISDEAVDHLALSTERTMTQDPAFGFRQLVDIGQKALSPSVNDPTTAVQAIDLLHDLLRKLATRPFPWGQRSDPDGALRLTFPVMTWDAYVHLACDELRHYGGTSLQVMRRLRAMLEDIDSVAPEDRRRIVRTQLALLAAAIDRNWPDVEDRQLGLVGDPQGMGDQALSGEER